MSVNLGKVKSGPNYKAYIILFIIISFGVLAFVIHTSLARATITLSPLKDITPGAINITVSPDATGNLVAFNAVNGTIISKKVRTAKTFSNVEKQEIDSFATGTITLVNERDEDQPLLPNTQLLSDSGILFKTQERVNVPANSSVKVNIKAAEKGTSGNVGPTKFVIAKLWQNWQDLIYGESTEALTGGRVNDFVITKETIESAKESFAAQIAQDIAEELSPTLPESETITPESVIVEITDYKPKVEDGDIAETFDATITADVTAVSFNKSLIQEVAEEKIQEQIAESKEIINLNQDSLTYTLSSVDAEKQSAVVAVSISAETMNKIPSKALEKENLVGRTAGDVNAYYKQFNEVGDVSVSFFPFWVQNIPANEGNIDIQID